MREVCVAVYKIVCGCMIVCVFVKNIYFLNCTICLHSLWPLEMSTRNSLCVRVYEYACVCLCVHVSKASSSFEDCSGVFRGNLNVKMSVGDSVNESL